MASKIEDYALLSNMRSGPLVSRHGSVDWWCVPRFDSPALFAALLGTPDHGRWLLAPYCAVDDDAAVDMSLPGVVAVERFYAENTFVLHTVWSCWSSSPPPCPCGACTTAISPGCGSRSSSFPAWEAPPC